MKKDILKVFGTNLIKMLVALISAFVIPMILSVDDYGRFKLYTFYASYIGITHLGYCDGIYLKYGGYDKDQISRDSIRSEWFTLLLYELFVAIAIVLYGSFKADLIVICLGLTVVPNVLFTFYTQVFQATGDFTNYTRIMNTSTAVNLIVNLTLVVFKVRDYKVYIICYILIQIVSFVVGTVSFKNEEWIGFSDFSVHRLSKYIKMGILLMVGNFAYTLFIGIDKWFIKFTMELSDFSMYSFASQLLTVVNMFVTPISMTLYSNMSRRKDQQFEIRIKRILLVFLMIFPMAIYAITFIVQNFMKQYIPAIEIISILLITQLFLLLNLAVFVNMYKTYKKQKDYFSRLVSALLIAAIMDLIVYFVGVSTVGYALATLTSCFIWLSLNISYFPYMKPTIKEILYCVIMLGTYVCLLTIPNVLARAAIYLIAYLVATRLIMIDEWKYGMTQAVVLIDKIKRI